ncbi:hypothetical protein CC79DRAFT_5919 [Sarocladium strictum]
MSLSLLVTLWYCVALSLCHGIAQTKTAIKVLPWPHIPEPQRPTNPDSSESSLCNRQLTVKLWLGCPGTSYVDRDDSSHRRPPAPHSRLELHIAGMLPHASLPMTMPGLIYSHEQSLFSEVAGISQN